MGYSCVAVIEVKLVTDQEILDANDIYWQLTDSETASGDVLLVNCMGKYKLLSKFHHGKIIIQGFRSCHEYFTRAKK